MIGTTLSHYRITARLGAGGMGEVYRAQDTTLGRDVALKLLPLDFTADPERLARFEREARLLAQLNHPNVAAIHGFEHADGKPFLVLELVEGEDLAARLKRGPIPVDEAIEIGRQIAGALEAAHERGIVHRDLKPANVKLSGDGKVKVLDFGLAKAWSKDPLPPDAPVDMSHSPTLSHGGTQAGVILGTAAYMSPEQARGKPVDKGADIWALGVVLWEMVAGRPLFTGETVSDVLAAVLTRQPDWGVLPPAGAGLRGVLERCLERDPRHRMRDAGDVRLELERVAAQPAAPPALVRTRPWSGRAPWLAALFAAGVAGVLVGRLLAPAPARRSAPLRLSIPLAPTQEVVTTDNGTFAFSPDGQSLVFAAKEGGRRRLFRRRLDAPEVAPIEGTDDGSAPAFSTDGRWLSFVAGGKFKRVAAEGGRPLDIADQNGAGGATWLSSSDVVFAPIYSDGLFRVSADGGTPKRLTTPDRAHGELGHWWPQPLPGGTMVLFTGFHTPVDTSRIAVLALDTGAVRDVVDGGFFGRYVPSGHLLYAKGQRLYAAPFDPSRAVLTGPAKPVLDDLYTAQTGGYSAFDVSADGTLAYVAASVAEAPRELVWIDREGRVEPAVREPGRFRDLSLSPDGKQLAATIQGDSLDLWTLALDRGTLSRLTTSPGTEFCPLWSASGRDVFFVVDRPPFEIHRIPFGSAAEERPLFKEPAERDTIAGSASPDGRLIAFTVTEPGTGSNIWVRAIDGSEPPRSFRSTRASEDYPTFSPDGRWLAYESDETGRPEVYVEAFPGPGERRQVSADGGREPLWVHSGDLFYRHDDEMRVVPTRTRPRFEFDPPRTLFALSLVSGVNSARSYGVTADGRRVVAIRVPEATAARRIEVVTHWLDEIRRLVGNGS